MITMPSLANHEEMRSPLVDRRYVRSMTIGGRGLRTAISWFRHVSAAKNLGSRSSRTTTLNSSSINREGTVHLQLRTLTEKVSSSWQESKAAIQKPVHFGVLMTVPGRTRQLAVLPDYSHWKESLDS